MEQIGEVLHRIYQAEIPGRIEWMFDDGFVWVLVNRQRDLPRLWMDDALSGHRTVAQSELAARGGERAQFLTADWQERGREHSLAAAVAALGDAIVRHYEDSEFARWWRQLRGTSAA